MGIRRVVIPHCGGEISLLHRRLVGACRAPCSKRGESAGARPSGFISRALDTPTGTNVGEGRVGNTRAAERAGSAHGAISAPKRAIFLVESIMRRFRGRYERSCSRSHIPHFGTKAFYPLFIAIALQ